MIQKSKLNLDRSAIEISISQGVNFLSHNQLADGEFKTYRAPGDSLEEGCEFDSSPFTTTFVVYALSFLETLQTKDIQEKALNFLATQMEHSGVWRYWSSKNSMHRLIPPDIDDTCCISFVLKKYMTAPNNNQLILGNRNRQGLFYTWFLPRFSLLSSSPRLWLTSLPEFPARLMFWRNTEAAPGDIDCGVNANVVLYLGEIEETKAAIAYLIDVTLKGQEAEHDKWYLSRFPYYYFLSRAYFNGVKSLEVVKQKVITTLEQTFEQEGYNNPLDTALAACTFMNFEQPSTALHEAISFLLKTQRANGDWIRIPLYFGGPKRYYGWGSSELTTAFCIEALARYQQII